MVSTFSPFLRFLRGKLPASVGGTTSGFSILAAGGTGAGLLTPRGGLLGMEWVRTNIQINFPRPQETKRIRKHGWNTRMKTKGGRSIIMRRILKGRFILSH